jgi:predicted MFS family arabinose efflux permease
VLVAGSTLLADVLRSYEKGQVQGLADALVNVASGVGSLGGSLMFAAIGFTTMSWIGLSIALIPLLLVIFLRATRSEVALGGSATG